MRSLLFVTVLYPRLLLRVSVPYRPETGAGPRKHLLLYGISYGTDINVQYD